MSLILIRQRILALLLFFIEYKALILCFTLLSLSISTAKLIEQLVFEERFFNYELLLDCLLPTTLLYLFFIVSYGVIYHVQFLTTIVKTLVLSIIIVFPFAYYQWINITKMTYNVQRFTTKNVWITGVITSQEKNNTYLLSSGEKALGNSLVRFRVYPVLHTGQRCKILGKVVQPRSFEDFDYRKYLFRKGVYSILEVEEYVCTNGGNIFLELRYRLERVVEQALPEPEASLLIGIMFGSKRVFRSDINSALSATGVSHIIAASGYNVALVAQGVDMITRKRGGRGKTFLKVLCIWVFSIFSGLSPSLVRASTMTTISLIALFFGRESNKAATLILCITVLILFNPFLIYDVGFLFSFASVVGLIFLPKCFENIKSEYIKGSILPTLTCILFTLPISVVVFGKVSVISLISNIVVLPIVGSTIFWGVISTLLNILFPLKFLYIVPYIQLNIFKQFVLIVSNIQMVEIHLNKSVFGAVIYLSLLLLCIVRYPISSTNYYLNLAKRK